MPAAVAPVVGAIASGPISGIVSSVVSSVAGSALSGAMGAGGGGGGLAGIIGSFTNAFSGLLGQASGGQHMMPTSPFAQPFSPFGMNPSVFNDPFSVLRGAMNTTQDLANGLQNILGDLFGGKSGGQSIGGTGAPGSSLSGLGSLDSLKQDALKAAQSGDLQGMLAAQDKMAKLQNAFALESQMISISAGLVSKAIAGMRVQG